MNAVIFGASGMVGIEVLHASLNNSAITRIDAIVRKRIHDESATLHQHVLEDMSDMSSIRDVLSQADVCFYCIGVYQGKVPDDVFWRVTVDYLQELLEQFSNLNTSPVFCLFSSAGADPRERRWSPLFARAKGRAERLLMESSVRDYYIVRPGYINPGRKAADSRMPDWLARPFYKLVPALGIDAGDLGAVIVELVMFGHEKQILENSDLRRAAKKLHTGTVGKVLAR
ncbi:MAG: NAD(P)H-binding protein [Rhodothermales bacterium]|nr:NAD(P)H-binding protein [Rhodothermales bacterium]